MMKIILYKLEKHSEWIPLYYVLRIYRIVRLFGYLFSLIGQPGVIGEIVAGIVL